MKRNYVNKNELLKRILKQMNDLKDMTEPGDAYRHGGLCELRMLRDCIFSGALDTPEQSSGGES